MKLDRRTQRHIFNLFSVSPKMLNFSASLERCKSLYLPELLEFVNLLGRDLTGPQLLLLGRDLHQPGQKAAVLDERLPLRAVPINVLQTALTRARLPNHTNTHTHP